MKEDTAKIYLNSGHGLEIGQTLTISGIKHYNRFQRFVRLFFKKAFEKIVPNTIYEVVAIHNDAIDAKIRLL